MPAATRVLGLAFAALAALPLSPARAQSVADFYRGKSLNLYIGFSVGGAYDLYGRLVARHMGKHIPGNPNIIPQNMAGAGSLRVANFIYTAAPKDGTAFATMGRGAAFGPMFNQSGAAFDAQKYTWLGSANDEVSLCTSWHTSGITKFEDILTRELIIAASGPTDETATVPRAINGILGTKMRVVAGRCGLSWSSAKANLRQWLDEKKLQLLFQVSYARHADLPDTPLIMDFAKTDEQRQMLRIFAARQVMGRPFLAPPDLPKERADALRAAFMATLQDKEFLAEAEKAQLEITPVSGERVQVLVDEVYATPPAIVKKAAEFVVP
jgi:hypothetical protein